MHGYCGIFAQQDAPRQARIIDEVSVLEEEPKMKPEEARERKSPITIRLDDASIERVDWLVEAEICPDRPSAAMFLILAAIKENDDLFGRIRAGLDDIRRTEEALRDIGMAGGEAEREIRSRRHEMAELAKAAARHEKVRNSTILASQRLSERKHSATEVVERVEAYVNGLANSPKEFRKLVAESRVRADRFKDDVERLEQAAAHSTRVGNTTGAAGVLAGAGVAALGPSVAVAVATTFGTASTGTAISALSGAAAANAALAWLGGGALAAGGGGMAAGSALLALAGPAGLTVAGLALVGAAVYKHRRNRKCAQEAHDRRVEVKRETRLLKAAEREIDRLEQQIDTCSDGCRADVDWFSEHAPSNYAKFGDHLKKRLGALINNIQTLGELLGKQVTLADTG